MGTLLHRAAAGILPAALLVGAACAATTAGGQSAARPSAAPAAAPAAVRADTAALRRTLDSIADAHRGVVGYTVHDLDGGARLERRGDETFPTASLIKVPILVTLYDQIEKGRISLDDRIVVTKIDKVPGSGILQSLHDGHEITVGDAAWLMTTISDNTATNLLLDKVPMRVVWDKMESLGLPHTKVHSRTFQRYTSVAVDSSAKYGLGVTTPNEMARLFELLAGGKAVSPRADSAMLATLADNQDEALLQRHVSGVFAARKTGATDQVRTECVLWRLPTRVVACVLTKENQDTRWLIDNEAQVTMARMGETIVRAFRPASATDAR
ncbi:MAG TPA: serine hydrolase [Gemmatimonadaceae bacterium]|nr:serine hydrolase [Gemmatimonadaceae bacterium]